MGGKTTAYAYDAVGNRTSRATPGATVTYAYDPANQSTAATRTGLLPQAVAFTHDGAGRLSGATSSVAGLASSRSLSYDAKGHLAALNGVRPGLLGGTLVDATTRTIVAAGVSRLQSRRDVGHPLYEDPVDLDGVDGVAA